MIIVTGGAGFIGSNIVKALNDRGRTDILIVDDLTDGRKIRNIQNLEFLDYIDCDDFDCAIADGTFDVGPIEVVFHEGACADTMEYNGKYMMKNNYEGSKNLFHYCQDRRIPFIYASSASTYGNGTYGFVEKRRLKKHLTHMRILNCYSTVMYVNMKVNILHKLWGYVILTYMVLMKPIKIKWLL